MHEQYPTTPPARWTEQQLDQRISDDVYQGHDDHAIAEGLVDLDVSRGEYPGCSSSLEMAFTEYEARAARMREQTGRLPGYVVDANNPAPGQPDERGYIRTATGEWSEPRYPERTTMCNACQRLYDHTTGEGHTAECIWPRPLPYVVETAPVATCLNCAEPITGDAHEFVTLPGRCFCGDCISELGTVRAHLLARTAPDCAWMTDPDAGTFITGLPPTEPDDRDFGYTPGEDAR